MKVSFSGIALISILLLSTPLMAQEASWMGKRVSNTAMFLDPTEIQFSGSITALLDRDLSEYQYLPFGFGAAQSIVSKQLEENKAWEIVGEMGAFTQFEWKEVDGSQERNLLNTDYRITFAYIRKLNKAVTYRIRFYHVSSHQGDDFIFRNRIRNFTENKVNYEQLEFTYFRNIGAKGRVYGGLGAVVRPNSNRERLSYHAGTHMNIKEENKNWGWSMGLMVKGFQETDFNPNLKLGLGPAYFAKSKQEPIRLLVELYTGNLPYSQFEDRQIEWLGLGLYFYI